MHYCEATSLINFYWLYFCGLDANVLLWYPIGVSTIFCNHITHCHLLSMTDSGPRYRLLLAFVHRWRVPIAVPSTNLQNFPSIGITGWCYTPSFRRRSAWRFCKLVSEQGRWSRRHRDGNRCTTRQQPFHSVGHCRMCTVVLAERDWAE